MKTYSLLTFLLAILAPACASSSSNGSADAAVLAACPEIAGDAAAVDLVPGACVASVPGEICEVSGGTKTCKSVCAEGFYESSCLRASASDAGIPVPDPKLGCAVIATPTPADELFYCCPCGG